MTDELTPEREAEIRARVSAWDLNGDDGDRAALYHLEDERRLLAALDEARRDAVELYDSMEAPPWEDLDPGGLYDRVATYRDKLSARSKTGPCPGDANRT